MARLLADTAARATEEGDGSGCFDWRVTDEHRLVYKLVDDEVRIAACRYHYG